MTVEGIVFLSLITFIAVLFVVKSTMQDVLLKKYKERISNNEKENSVVMKYCLNSILEKSVEIEDYETAKRCKMLIENLNKHEKNNSEN